MNESPLLPPNEPPVQPPVQPPTYQPQPPTPNTAAQQAQTDVLGIVSIVMIFVAMQPVGFILGLIGASKAKREGRSPILSRIGWIANLVTMLFAVFFIVLFVALAVVSQPSTSGPAKGTSLNSGASATTRQVTVDGFSLAVPKKFEDLPEAYKNTAANYTQGDSEANEYALVIKENASDFRDTMTVQDYADLLNKDYQTGDSVKNAVVTPLTGVSNTRKLDVVDYTMTGESGDLQIVYYIRYVKTATSFYQVMTWTSPSTATTAKSELLPILESFYEA